MDDIAIPDNAVQLDQPTAEAPATVQGFQPPGVIPDHEVQLDSDKYGTTKQQIKAGLEGIGRGVLGPIAPAVERGLGIATPEAMAGRAKENPGIAGIGEAGGLGASALTGVGAASALEHAGQAAAGAAGLGNLAKDAGYFSKVGSAAVKGAAEMGLLESGNETSKYIMGDPDSAQTALANVGLSAALGGAGSALFQGAVSPIWKATVGDKLGAFLNDVTAKLGGKEAGESLVQPLADQAGVEIPDVLRAKIEGNPTANELDSKLSQTDTTYSGKKYQEAREGFREELGNKMVEALGHEPNYISTIPDLDKYNTGNNMAETLHTAISDQVKPVADAYEATTNRFKAAPLAESNIKQIADDIAKKSMEQGWHKAESDANTKLMQRVLEKLPQQENADDLKKFITNLRQSNPWGSDTYGAARDISKALEGGQGRAISDAILAKGGEGGTAEAALAEYQALKSRYAGLMDTIDNLNEHLHVGRYDGPKTFLNALKEMGTTNGEAVLNRLSGSNKANTLELLGKISPETLAQVRQYHVDKLLHAAGGEKLSPESVIKNFNKLSPQLKNLIADEGRQSQIQAIGELAEKMKDPNHNFSNTARTADKLAHGSPSPLAMVAALLGHGTAAIASHVGKIGINEGRDAIKYGMLKFLGSEQPIKAEGFKAMLSLIHHSIQGESMLSKGAAAIFKSGAQVLGTKALPSDADRVKLDKIVTNMQKDPDAVAKLNDSDVGHYMPDHGQALSQAAATQVQYLHNLKPQEVRNSPLDKPIPPSKAAEARYNKALDIAINPAIVYQHIKEGTLQPTDLQDLKGMYPAVFDRMSQKLTEQISNQEASDESIPYRTRMSLSLFLGQPMDSTMNPMSIVAAQPKPQQAPPNQQQSGNKKPSAKAGTAMEKGAKSYQTASQDSESDRTNRS